VTEADDWHARVALRNVILSSAVRVAIANLQATDFASLPTIQHVIRSLEDAYDRGGDPPNKV
jgi:hypothetical protein